MASDPVCFCHERLPGLYAEAIVALEALAEQGDDRLAARLEEARSAPVTTAVTFVRQSGKESGEDATLYLRTDGKALGVSGEDPSSRARYALSLPDSAARYGIAEFERAASAGLSPAARVARALSVLASQKARELFTATAYAFDLQVMNVPVLETLRARIALGRAGHPPVPEFELAVDYDELEDAREQGTPLHQLFLSGKIKVEGDAAKAMMLGMTLAQLR